MKRLAGQERLHFPGRFSYLFLIRSTRSFIPCYFTHVMTRELSLLKCFRADKTNLLQCEKIQKETVPDGHEQGDHVSLPVFPGPGAGARIPSWEAERAPVLRDLHVGPPVNGDGMV